MTSSLFFPSPWCVPASAWTPGWTANEIPPRWGRRCLWASSGTPSWRGCSGCPGRPAPRSGTRRPRSLLPWPGGGGGAARLFIVYLFHRWKRQWGMGFFYFHWKAQSQRLKDIPSGSETLWRTFLQTHPWCPPQSLSVWFSVIALLKVNWASYFRPGVICPYIHLNPSAIWDSQWRISLFVQKWTLPFNQFDNKNSRKEIVSVILN